MEGGEMTFQGHPGSRPDSLPSVPVASTLPPAEEA